MQCGFQRQDLSDSLWKTRNLDDLAVHNRVYAKEYSILKCNIWNKEIIINSPENDLKLLLFLQKKIERKNIAKTVHFMFLYIVVSEFYM